MPYAWPTMQGLGYGLLEQSVVDRATGRVLATDPDNYKLPTALDVPTIDHALLSRSDPHCNITGAKGLGEPPIIATAAAIANAVYDAIGVRIRELPLTPDRVLRALAAQEEEGRHG